MSEYRKQYYAFINFRKVDKPLAKEKFKTHDHHIKPRCLFPELINDPENIVTLTVSEHIYAHKLLMLWMKDEYGTDDSRYIKMFYAYTRTIKYMDKRLKKENQRLTSIRNRNSIWINDGISEFFVLKSTVKNYPGFQIGRLSKPNINRIVVNNGKRIRYVDPNHIPRGYKIGSISLSTKDKVWITNSVQQTLINKTDPVPAGWKYGSLNKQAAHTIWVNNGKQMKRVSPDNIPIGWSIGKLPSKSKGKLIYVNNGEIARKVYPDQIPPGFVKGNLSRNHVIEKAIKQQMITV